MRANRTLRVACLVAAVLLLPLDAARACSCAFGDPRDQFQEADGAFVGTFIESHLAEPPDPSGGFSSTADTIYTFELDQEYKGELGEPGDTVEVHSAFSGASCGLEVEAGEQYGLFLRVRQRDQAWTSNLCSQVTPEMMREAASPLPAPDGQGPVRLLVGGSFGRAQVMGLDRRGRTLAYGYGGSEVRRLDVCPGGDRAVELAQMYPQPPHLVVRSLQTFRKVREIELPFGRGNEFRRQDPEELDCRDRAGRRVLVFGTNHREPRASSVVLRIVGRLGRIIHEGRGLRATFGERHVYIQHGSYGRHLLKVSLRTGRSTELARLPRRNSGRLVLSPDGKRLAGIAQPSYDRIEEKSTVFFTVRVDRTDSLRRRSLAKGEVYGYAAWMSSRRPVAFMAYPGPSKVFNLRLRAVSRFERWRGGEPVFVGRRAFGTDYGGGLIRVRPTEGAVRRVRELPSPVAYAIVSVP